MKEIKYKAVNCLQEQTVDVVSTDKYYGVSFGWHTRGFITQQEYRSGKYMIRSFSGVTKGNGWPDFDHANLAELINHIKKSCAEYHVIEFDTQKDLLNWLQAAAE